VVDGAPSREACQPYGFVTDDRLSDDMAARRPAPPMNVAAPPPPPPPPPPPIAAPQVGEFVTSGSRVPPGTQTWDITGVVGKTSPDSKGNASVYAGFSHQQARVPPPVIVRPNDTEKYPNATVNSVKRVAEAPVSTFSIDVDTAAYANIRRFLTEGVQPPRDAVRVEELVNYFDYAYPQPASAQEPFKAFVAVAPSPWAPGKQIVHIGLQGYGLGAGERPPLNLVFLLDVSGSMMPEDRLPLAVKALNLLIDQLKPQDHVSIAVYAGAAGQVLAPTPGYEKLKLRCALSALHAGGSTAGGQGLSLAYKLAEANFDPKAVNRVILMTDGDFNVGVTSERPLTDFVAEKRKSGVYLSVYGYGRGNYNDLMMQSLAQSGNGTAAYVDGLDEARKLFREDFTRGLFPIADDVKIQVEFNPARVAEYRLIGYETRLLNREDFNNDKVDAGEVGAGASVTALYELTPVSGPVSADPLRYQAEPQAKPGAGGELAFLRVRYKLPGQAQSHLMERPITDADWAKDLDQAPRSTRFALAVAAFGQKLRGDPYMGDFGWSQVVGLAQTSEGDDTYGLRRQFVDLAAKASDVRALND
jgi:Ca-activated chloride channel family protein